MNVLKKITAKEVFGGKPEIGMSMVIGGAAWGHIVKSTQYGESFGIEGDFTAVNSSTKEVFTAPLVYLPQDAAQSIVNRLDARKDQSEIVEFSMNISVVPSDKSRTGYSFLCQQLQTKESLDRRQEIANRLMASVEYTQQLEAPKAKKSA